MNELMRAVMRLGHPWVLAGFILLIRDITTSKATLRVNEQSST